MTVSMRNGSVKQRQFSVKMRNFHNSMRQRTKSDADSKVVPVFKVSPIIGEFLRTSENNFSISGSLKKKQMKVKEFIQAKDFELQLRRQWVLPSPMFSLIFSLGKRTTMEDVTAVRGPFREGKSDEYFGVCRDIDVMTVTTDV